MILRKRCCLQSFHTNTNFLSFRVITPGAATTTAKPSRFDVGGAYLSIFDESDDRRIFRSFGYDNGY